MAAHLDEVGVLRVRHGHQQREEIFEVWIEYCLQVPCQLHQQAKEREREREREREKSESLLAYRTVHLLQERLISQRVLH